MKVIILKDFYHSAEVGVVVKASEPVDLELSTSRFKDLKKAGFVTDEIPEPEPSEPKEAKPKGKTKEDKTPVQTKESKEAKPNAPAAKPEEGQLPTPPAQTESQLPTPPTE